jgi:hypothetical protein
LKEPGSQDNSVAMPCSRAMDTANRAHRQIPKKSRLRYPLALAPLLLRSMCRFSAGLLGEDQGRQKLDEQRAIWKSMLPKPLLHRIEFSLSGLHIDHLPPPACSKLARHLVYLDDDSFFPGFLRTFTVKLDAEHIFLGDSGWMIQ